MFDPREHLEFLVPFEGGLGDDGFEFLEDGGEVVEGDEAGEELGVFEDGEEEGDVLGEVFDEFREEVGELQEHVLLLEVLFGGEEAEDEVGQCGREGGGLFQEDVDDVDDVLFDGFATVEQALEDIV